MGRAVGTVLPSFLRRQESRRAAGCRAQVGYSTAPRRPERLCGRCGGAVGGTGLRAGVGGRMDSCLRRNDGGGAGMTEGGAGMTRGRRSDGGGCGHDGGRPARKSDCSDLPGRWRCHEVTVGSFRYLVRARPEPPSACGISPRGAGGEGKWRLRAGLLGGSSWIGLHARCGGSCHGVREGGFPAPQRGGPPLPPACAGAGFGISPAERGRWDQGCSGGS